MRELVFPVAYIKEYKSYIAGKTFAKLYFSANKDLNAYRLEELVNTLKIKESVFNAFFYKLGFKHQYMVSSLDSGKKIPVTTVLVQEEKLAMGKLQAAQTATKQGSEFLKTETLVAADAIFCIRRIDTMTGNFGEQWVLTVLIDPSVVGDLESVEPVERKISFSFGTKGKNSRDRTLEALKGEEPVHNVTITSTAMKNGSTYYDFGEDETSVCTCGHVPELPEKDALGDLDDHPF